jgi:hypothetical protein
VDSYRGDKAERCVLTGVPLSLAKTDEGLVRGSVTIPASGADGRSRHVISTSHPTMNAMNVEAISSAALGVIGSSLKSFANLDQRAPNRARDLRYVRVTVAAACSVAPGGALKRTYHSPIFRHLPKVGRPNSGHQENGALMWLLCACRSSR